MATGIEWTDETWNPVVGCQHVSPGCDGCYAAREAHGRLSHIPVYAGLTASSPGELPWFTGEVRCLPERLEQPLHWRKPRRVFVNSMSDLFHHDVPTYFVDDVFATMATTERHTYQILTKRPKRLAAYLAGDRAQMQMAYGYAISRAISGWPLSNVWLGTSIEEQRYTFRAAQLAEAPAAVRFLSIEPLIGPVDLDHHSTDEWRTAIHWVIVGAESGPKSRPMEPDWARALRDQCVDAGVPFFVKQLTNPASSTRPLKDLRDFPADLRIREYPSNDIKTVALSGSGTE